MAKRKASKKQIAQRNKFKRVQKKCKGKTGRAHKSCVSKGLKK